MTWHADSGERQTQTVSHKYVEGRKRDGNTLAGFDDSMKIAIVGIVVMDAIAGKTLVLKEERAEESGGFPWRTTFGMPFCSKFFSQTIETLLIMGNIVRDRGQR